MAGSRSRVRGSVPVEEDTPDLPSLIRRARETARRRSLAYLALNQSFEHVEELLQTRYPTRVSAIELQDGKAALLFWQGKLWILRDNNQIQPLLQAPSALRQEAASALDDLLTGLQDESET